MRGRETGGYGASENVRVCCREDARAGQPRDPGITMCKYQPRERENRSFDIVRGVSSPDKIRSRHKQDVHVPFIGEVYPFDHVAIYHSHSQRWSSGKTLSVNRCERLQSDCNLVKRVPPVPRDSRSASLEFSSIRVRGSRVIEIFEGR